MNVRPRTRIRAPAPRPRALRPELPQACEDIILKLLEKDADNPQVHEGLGYVLFREEKYGESAEHYERMTALSPESYEGWYNLGLAQQRQGR